MIIKKEIIEILTKAEKLGADFMLCPEHFQIFSNWINGKVKTDTHDMLLGCYLDLKWAKNGFPMFKPTESAFAAFAHTDVPASCYDLIKFPFRTFYIKIPDRFWILNNGGRIDCFDYIFVNVFEDFIYDSTIAKESGTLLYSEFMDKLKNNSETWIHVGARYATRDCEIRTTVPLMDYINCAPSYKIMEDLLDDGEDCIIKDEIPVIDAIKNVVVSMCLYISNRPSDSRKEKKYTTKRKSHRIDISARGAKPQVWIVGKDIILGKEQIEEAKTDPSSRTFRLKNRFTVRGHWRNQACGDGRSDRKMIWVQPYWKGPRDGSVLVRAYTQRSE
ncbi:MAG: hypothetical protein V1755_05525 [Chloroflexota bacterium]